VRWVLVKFERLIGLTMLVERVSLMELVLVEWMTPALEFPNTSAIAVTLESLGSMAFPY
jgi:hypothetical protein